MRKRQFSYKVLAMPWLLALVAWMQTSTIPDLSTVALAEKNGLVVVPFTQDIDHADIPLSSLEPGRTYYATVIVKDEAGNKAVYGTTSFTTPKLADQPPPTLSAPPAVVITKPTASLVSGNKVGIESKGTDDKGIVYHAIYINDTQVKAPCACATVTYTWNSNPYKGKIVRIGAVVKDADGQTKATVKLVQVR
jgi:hypothetical protein